ncbi:MAG: hypothetical protein JWR16_500 [Nevskia sp.]|nr:hypothetical protein [Nevskia sp.]
MYEQKRIVLSRIGIAVVGLIVVSGGLTILLSLYTGEMGTLLFSLLAGGLGAGVSLVRRLPSLQESELEFLAASWWSLVVPIVVSALMAGFLYFAFFAGILTGDGGGGLFTSNLFPNFTKPDLPAGTLMNLQEVLKIRPVSIQDFGKLVTWCFLSGYSERLVPNLLESLERRGAGGKE